MSQLKLLRVRVANKAQRIDILGRPWRHRNATFAQKRIWMQIYTQTFFNGTEKSYYQTPKTHLKDNQPSTERPWEWVGFAKVRGGRFA